MTQERTKHIDFTNETMLRDGRIQQVVNEDGVVILSLVERADSRPEFEDCRRYVFGTDDIRAIDGMRKMMGEVSGLVPGAVVFYSWMGLPSHVGIVDQDGLVVSKWGKGKVGHVFRHLPDYVPEEFGEIVECRTFPPGLVREV